MKEPMCTHLAKRGNVYYFRRKIPLELLSFYDGRKEIMRSLGTSNRKEAERLVRIEGIKTDEEFLLHQTPRMNPFSNTPVAEVTPSESVLLGIHIVERHSVSPTLIAYEMKLYLREQRKEASSFNTLKSFMTRCKREFAFHSSVLDGEENPIWKMDWHEGVRIAFQAFLTGEGNSGITAGHVARHATPASPGQANVIAAGSETLLGDLLDKWQTEQSPHGKTVQMFNRTIVRFFTYVGHMPVHKITRTHVVEFKNKLLESGQTQINTNKLLFCTKS